MLDENRLREKSGKRRRLSFFLKLAADLRIREANCQGRFVLYENSCTQCGIQWRMHTVWMVHTVACQTADTHSVNRKAHCVWHWCSTLASVARTRSAYMCVHQCGDSPCDHSITQCGGITVDITSRHTCALVLMEIYRIA